MFSHEIDQKIKQYNHQLPSSIYLEISDTNNNPQINHIKYNAYSDSFFMRTKDGWYWDFKVYKE